MKAINLFITLLILAVLSCGQKDSPKFITEKNQSNIITFRIQFKIGSIHDPVGKEGLNSLTALTLSEGGSKQRSYEDIKKALYPMAATFTSNPDKEVTTFEANCHVDSLDSFYAIMMSLLTSPRFDSSDFQRNRELMVNQIKNTLRNNDDENLGKKTLETELYRNHPYGHIDEGTVKGLESITLDDVRNYYAQHYGRNNVVIGLAGNYPDQIRKKLSDDFAKMPVVTAEIKPLPQPEKIQDLEVTIVQKEAFATAISMGFPIEVNRSNPDFYPLLLVNAYLGEHRNSSGILYQRIREKRGMNYGDYSYVENFIQEPGTRLVSPNIPRRQQFFSIWIRPVVHHNALFAMRCALYELNKLVDKELTQEQLDVAKTFIINYSKLFIQTQSRRLGFELDSDWYGTEFYIDKIEKELKKVTLDQVNAAIKKHLQGKNLKIAIITNDAEGVKNILLNNTPTSITYPSAKPEQNILDEDKIVEAYPLNINKEKLKIVKTDELF
ncbi:insulinase family protein [bacterium]|nr:insulinase family protein [bacterium]